MTQFFTFKTSTGWIVFSNYEIAQWVLFLSVMKKLQNVKSCFPSISGCLAQKQLFWKIILLTVCQKLSLEFYVFIGRRHQANNWNWYWLYWIHRLWTSTRRQRIFNWGKIVKLFIGKVIYIAHYFIMLQLNPFDHNVDRRGTMAWALCVIVAGLIIKTFPDHGYFRSKDGVVWLWYLLVKLYIRIYIYTIYILFIYI